MRLPSVGPCVAWGGAGGQHVCLCVHLHECACMCVLVSVCALKKATGLTCCSKRAEVGRVFPIEGSPQFPLAPTVLPALDKVYI